MFTIYDQIQADAIASRSPIATTVPWRPSLDLKKQTYDASAADPTDLLSPTEEKYKRNNYGN